MRFQRSCSFGSKTDYGRDRMTKGLLFKEGSKNRPEIIDYADDLTEFERIIGTDYIDVIKRYIHDTEIYIIVDDCGKLKDRRLTAYGQEELVGTLIICDINPITEDWTDLTDEKITTIMENLGRIVDTNEIILNNLRFRPEHIHGVLTSRWDAAAKQNKEAAEALNFLCCCEYLEPEVIEKQIDKILTNQFYETIE